MWRKLSSLTFAVLLVLSLLPTVGLAQATRGATQVSGKIETQLADLLAVKGSADFIVDLAEKADLSAAYKMTDWSARGHYVYETLRATAERTQAAAIKILDGRGLKHQTFFAGNVLYVWGGDLQTADALAALPSVKLVRATQVYELDPIQSKAALPNATFDWGILDTNADDFWAAYGVKGDGIVQANIDTGVDWTHDALQGNYKCTADPSSPACWLDPAPADCTGQDGGPCDSWTGVYHGTHTMGTQAGSDNPSLQYTVGMAPSSQWITCTGCPYGGCPDYDLNACSDWLLAPDNDPDNRPNVVNNSWGGGGGNTFYLAQVQAWVAAGIFPAFSAGNSYSCNSLGSPGDYQESFASAAHDSGRAIADFSSKGPSYFGDDPYTKPNISAPGVAVMSAMPGDGWQLMDGTSMASPHTAGAVALLWSCNPGLIGQIDQTFQILQDNADLPPDGDCGEPADGEGNYTFGYGYLNAYQAGLLWCGETGKLDGHVNSAKAPIEGATITAVRQGGGTLTDQTDATGYFTMTAMVGIYDVTASHPHYLPSTVNNVGVTTDTVTTVDFSLTPRGRLWGYVTDYDNGFGLDATVTADDGTTANTDSATGFYEMWLDPGTHVITATAENYAPESATVAMVSGADTRQDFALLAAIVFIPSPLHMTLDYGITDSTVATLTSRLPWPYDFHFKEKPGGFEPVLTSIPRSDGSFPRGATPPTLGHAPKVNAPDANAVAKVAELLGKPAFAIDVYPGYNLVSFDVDDVPGTWTVIANLPNSQYFAGDFSSGDFDTLYAIDYGYNELHAIDTATGAVTVIGPSVPAGGESWSGMAGSPDGTMYAASTNIGNSTLYTVDLATGAPTAIGSISDGACIIDIAVNADGEMYGVDICSDILVQIDPETGAGTVIGSIGFDANFAQGMDFEEESGTLYLAAFNNSSYQGELRICDTTTGNSTLVATFPGGAEVDSLAFATGGAMDVPWLAEEPISGTVPAESSINPTITFSATTEAGVDQPGDYLATLKVKGDPSVNVPVIMTVLPPEDWGKLNGTVTGLGYCDEDPAPLEEAVVLIEASDGTTWTVQTDAAGHYQWWLDEDYSPLAVTVTYPQHQTGTATGVVIVGEMTTTLNFDLRWLVPCLSVTPSSLEASLMMGDTDTQQVTITNDGAGTANWAFMEQDKGFQPVLYSIPRSDGSFPRGSAPASLGRAPKTATVSGEEIADWVAAMAGAPAYAVDVYPGYNLVTFDSETPGSWTIIGNLPNSQYFAGDFLGGDFSKLYAIDYGLNALHTLDTATGAVTVVGPALTYGGESWTGLVGAPDGTLYASSSACSSRSTLYTVNPDSGETTVIGEVTNAPCLIDIAVNAEGEMYGVDIVNDVLVEIDPATGAGTAIGSIGFDANFAQGMDFEEESGVLYLAAFNNSTGQGELRICDTATGNSVLVGGFPGGAEVDSLGFATGGGGDVPWLYEDPVSGTLAADGGIITADVTLDANVVFQPGIYKANLNVKSDDPVNKKITLPVTMTVTVPAWYGKLAGTVTGLGYCDEDPAPLKDAVVVVQSAVGDSWTLETEADGYYQIWLDSNDSPYSVDVTYPEHEAGQATGVVIVGQQITPVNFDLRWLKPCLSVAPLSMEATLEMGENEVQQVTITNDGAAAASFEFTERDRGFEPLLARSMPAAMPPAGRSNEPAAGPRVRVTPTPLLQEGVLIVEDFPAWGYAAHESILSANGIPYSIINASQIASTDLTDYKMVIVPSVQGGAFNAVYNANLAQFEDYIDGGGLLMLDIAEQMGDTPYKAIPFGSTNDVMWQDYNWIVDPAHPIFAGVANPYYGNYASHSYVMDPQPDDRILVTGGQTPGGITIMIERDHGAGMLVAGGQTFEFGWGGGQDAGLILENMIPYYYFEWTPSGGLPWLFEEPISGTVGADGAMTVADITFDAAQVAQPGHYYGTLNVKSDDPVNGKIGLPVTLTITAPATWGKLTGVVSGLGYCDQNPVPLEKAEVVAVGSSRTMTVTTDENGVYVVWLEQGSYDVTASAEEHTSTSDQVTVSGQQTTTLDLDLRSIQPCISVTPPSLVVTLCSDTSETVQLELVNTGAGPSPFKIRETTETLGVELAVVQPAPTGKVTTVTQKEAAPTRTESSSGPLGSGGPDPFGYTYIDSNEVGGPEYDWIEIAPPAGGSGTALGMTGIDDGYYWPVDLPFPFNFYGTDYTQMAVNSNGTLYFQDGYLTLANMPIPGDPGSGINAFIAHLWDDLYVSPGDIYYLYDDEKLIVEYYQDSGCCISPDYATWEVILFPNGSMLFQYQDVTFGDFRDYGADATIGIQGDPTTGLQYSYNTASLSSELAICFAYPGEPENCQAADVPWLAVEPVTGTIEADSFFDVYVTFTAFPTMTAGVYDAWLIVNTDDAEQPKILVPVEMTIVDLAPVDIVDVTYTIAAHQVAFDSTVTGGAPLTFAWTFGDGGTSGQEDPAHTYGANGCYQVTLTVSNACSEDVWTDEVCVENYYYYLPIIPKNQ